MERLNEYLKQRTEESENYRRKIQELENLIQTKYELEASRKTSQYETSIRELRY